MKIELGGIEAELTSSGAIYFAHSNTLVVADVHFGKAHSFRTNGIPIPSGTTSTDLEQLQNQILKFRPERLICLGDLFHSKAGLHAQLSCDLKEFADRHRELSFINIVGNHDLTAREFASEAGIEFIEELLEGAFLFRHEPQKREDLFTLCGHIHPVISLADVTRSRLRYKVFYIEDHHAILPAFGSLTGGWEVKPAINSRLVAIVEDQLVHIDSRKLYSAD